MRIELSSRPRRGPSQWITQWLVNAIALALAARWMPGVSLVADGRESVIMVLGASAVLGLLNLLLKPVLLLVTLPVNILSLGLFTLVINGAVLFAAAALVPGFGIDGFWHAVLAALFLSVVGMALNGLLGGARLRVERGGGD